VKEGYIETSIPLLKDQPFAKSLTIDGARRWTNYSTSGDANTWKAGAVYEPNDQILVRVTQSSDIRAPTAAELNPNISRFQSPIPDQFRTDGITTTNAYVVSGGNPTLKNEEAVTKTAGLVLKPSFIPGFRFSGDYYNIKVEGAIDSIPAGVSTGNCKSQNLLCELITFAGAPKASPLLEIRQNLQNLNKLHAEGAEFVFNYVFDALGGNFDATLNANYVIDLSSTSALGVKTHFDNLTGNAISVTNVTGVPAYKLDGVLTYTRDNWSVTAHPRYIPEAKLESAWIGPEDYGYNINLSNSVVTNRVKSAAYLDLAGTYTPTAKIFGGTMQIYGAVNNVFDKDPPSPLRFFGNGIHYDMPGRSYRLGIRTNW
jgi:outer membrane receptor protein involved in Fe transport